MSERVIIKARVDGIDFAEPIASLEEINAAQWVPQPVTLRDDEISLVETEPDEIEIKSIESEIPEDIEISAKPFRVSGSFIKSTYQQMVDLMGGEIMIVAGTEAYLHPVEKIVLYKAVRFRLKRGGHIILLNAKGSVQISANAGYGGLLKFPFSFIEIYRGLPYNVVINEGGDSYFDMLAVSPARIIFPAAGGNISVYVVSYIENEPADWQIASMPNWISISGEGTQHPVFSAEMYDNTHTAGNIILEQTGRPEKTAIINVSQYSPVVITNYILDSDGNILLDDLGDRLLFSE